jgi:hypothetical protein
MLTFNNHAQGSYVQSIKKRLVSYIITILKWNFDIIDKIYSINKLSILIYQIRYPEKKISGAISAEQCPQSQ